MNRLTIAKEIRDICDEFYTKPSDGMSNSMFKEASAKAYAVSALCTYIKKYPLDEFGDPAAKIEPMDVLNILNDFDSMMLQGLYESRSLHSKIVYEKGREVCRDMMDIFRDRIPKKERSSK